MKSDDLERLEESQEMQQLIHAAKEQYEQEKSVHPPVSYAAFAQKLRERQKDGKMKTKQESPERETFEVKGGKRSGISPWWLVAACLLGGIIGYGISTTSDRQEAGLERLAVADTVIVVRERVDTVYREVEVPSQPLVASRSTVKSKSTGLTKEHVKQSRKAVQKAEPAFISIEFLQQQQNLPDPNSECYAANGMTVAEGNYPFHLLATVPCK